VASAGGGLIPRYEQLAELFEQELELVRTGRYDALDELDAKRAELIATLPATPPVEARAALLRAGAAQSQSEGLLTGAVAIQRQQLVRLERGREVLGAYAPVKAAPRPLVDSRG
jgi:hypothetical protein